VVSRWGTPAAQRKLVAALLNSTFEALCERCSKVSTAPRRCSSTLSLPVRRGVSCFHLFLRHLMALDHFPVAALVEPDREKEMGRRIHRLAVAALAIAASFE